MSIWQRLASQEASTASFTLPAGASNLTPSPDALRLAFVAQDRSGTRVEVNGKRLARYEAVAALRFSPDSLHLAYAAQTKHGWVIARDDGDESEAWDEISPEGPVISPDSSRLAYLARRGDRWFAIVDEVVFGGSYESVKPGGIVFSADSQRIIYAVRTGGSEFTVEDGIQRPGYPYILDRSWTFSPDSTRVVYLAGIRGEWKGERFLGETGLVINIVTVEDPIEYEFQDNITQVQVTERMTFPLVMRSFLRQDPDVMMVGEMRDPESLAIGIQASLTGHLVLTTLHTNNAVETLGRMVEMGGEPYLIASTVICIVAQRLVRGICPQCREEFRPPDEEIMALGFNMMESSRYRFYQGRGCANCRNTGYRGRTGVFEILMNNRAIKQLTTRNASALDIYAAARLQGMHTMLEDGRDKILRGITTPGEVTHAVYTSALDSNDDSPLPDIKMPPIP